MMSIAHIRVAPDAFARAQARRPIAPTPKTRTEEGWVGVNGDDEVVVGAVGEAVGTEEERGVVGGRRPTRRAAWMRTERGSAREACS